HAAVRSGGFSQGLRQSRHVFRSPIPPLPSPAGLPRRRPSLPRPLSPRGREGRKTQESFFFIPSSPLGRGGVGEVRADGAATLKVKATAGSGTRFSGDFDGRDPLGIYGFTPAACITLGYRLYLRHVLPHRTAKRDPGVHPGVPPGARYRSHAPGDLRAFRVLLVRHGLQASEAAAAEGVPAP